MEGEKNSGIRSTDAHSEQAGSKPYAKMTRKELYEAVKVKGFRGTSRYTKARLLELLASGVAAPPPRKARPGKPKKAEPKPAAAMRPPAVAEETRAEEPAPGAPVSSESRVREKLVAPGPQEIYVDWGYPLPEQYGIDRIGVAVKDPNWLFAYWDLSGARRQEVAESHGREIFSVSRWHLRVVDTDSGDCLDFPVNIDSGNWYVPACEDATFRVQIGLITPEGEFIEFATAREVRTPRSRPSESVSEEWMVVDELFQRFLKQAGTPAASELSSSELAARIRDMFSK